MQSICAFLFKFGTKIQNETESLVVVRMKAKENVAYVIVGNKMAQNCSLCDGMCARACVYIEIHFHVLPPYAYRPTKIASRTTSSLRKWTECRVEELCDRRTKNSMQN